MDCDDLLKQLNEYVDGNLEPGVCDEFRAHLKDCNPCQVVVDNIRQTIRLFRNGQEVELPPECKAKLHALLRAKFEAKYASGKR
jgi:anti-sigma factor RsiW